MLIRCIFFQTANHCSSPWNRSVNVSLSESLDLPLWSSPFSTFQCSTLFMFSWKALIYSCGAFIFLLSSVPSCLCFARECQYTAKEFSPLYFPLLHFVYVFTGSLDLQLWIIHSFSLPTTLDLVRVLSESLQKQLWSSHFHVFLRSTLCMCMFFLQRALIYSCGSFTLFLYNVRPCSCFVGEPSKTTMELSLPCFPTLHLVYVYVFCTESLDLQLWIIHSFSLQR